MGIKKGLSREFAHTAIYFSLHSDNDSWGQIFEAQREKAKLKWL